MKKFQSEKKEPRFQSRAATKAAAEAPEAVKWRRQFCGAPEPDSQTLAVRTHRQDCALMQHVVLNVF